MRLTAAQLLRARLRGVPAELPRPRRHPPPQRRACSIPTASTRWCRPRATWRGASRARPLVGGRLFAGRQFRAAPGACARRRPGCRWRTWPRYARCSTRRGRWTAMEQRLAAVPLVLQAQMARFAARASASCSRSATISTTARSALRHARADRSGWSSSHTDFGTLDDYFDGYSIAGGRLAALQVPVSILTAADDPVIPVDDFHALRLPASATLEIAAHGAAIAASSRARVRRLRRALGGRAPGRGADEGCLATEHARRRRIATGRRIRGTSTAIPGKEDAAAMKIWSDSFEHRGRIPAEFAMGTPAGFRRQPQSASGLGRCAGRHAFVRAAVHRHRCADRCVAGRPRRCRDSGRASARRFRALGAGRHVCDDAAHRCRQLQRRRSRKRGKQAPAVRPAAARA